MKPSSGFFCTTAVVLGFLLGTVDQRAAFADQMLGLVEITCVPEAGYFSIRRLVFVNPPHQPGDHFQPLLSIASRHGIYTAIRLKAEPADCELIGASAPDHGGRWLRVRVQGSYDDHNGQAPGPRQIVEEVEVSAGGKPLGRLLLNAFGYLADEIDLMEVRFDGGSFWVDKCSYHQSVDPQAKNGCTREAF